MKYVSRANPVKKTATATIVVLNAIVANPDTTGGLPGATTGSVLGMILKWNSTS
jgi:hypothetical protein